MWTKRSKGHHVTWHDRHVDPRSSEICNVRPGSSGRGPDLREPRALPHRGSGCSNAKCDAVCQRFQYLLNISKYHPNTFQYPPIISIRHIININEASWPLGLIWINTLLEIRFDNECRWPMMTLEQTNSYTSCLHICMRFDASHIGLSNSMGLIGLHLHSEIYQRLLRYPLFMLPLQCKLSRRYQPFLFLFWIYTRSSVVFFFFGFRAAFLDRRNLPLVVVQRHFHRRKRCASLPLARYLHQQTFVIATWTNMSNNVEQGHVKIC